MNYIIYFYYLAMVSRYFILSGIPMTQISICNEVQKMISFLVENLRPSNSISEEGMEKFIYNSNIFF